ncbi:MAG: hypothetical protein M3P18_01750 [Actinomycetota bacterium]|nr:hypothetical protein [Actinomycetota bacterium]
MSPEGGSNDRLPSQEFPVPAPLKGGSRPTQSLGRWIDDLLGDSRYRNRARTKIDKLFEVTPRI